jgi:hypothetical protein
MELNTLEEVEKKIISLTEEYDCLISLNFGNGKCYGDCNYLYRELESFGTREYTHLFDVIDIIEKRLKKDIIQKVNNHG